MAQCCVTYQTVSCNISNSIVQHIKQCCVTYQTVVCNISDSGV